MFPMRVGLNEGTLDIAEYSFEKDMFVGSNGKTYGLKDINYFIIPTKEMKNIVNIQEEKEEEISMSKGRMRNYSK